MEKKRLYDNAIIIAPSQTRRALLSYRAEHPEQSFSIYSVEDIERMFSYSHDDRLIIDLIQNGYGYHEAKEVASVLDQMEEGQYTSKKLQKLAVFFAKYRQSGLLFAIPYPERTFAKRHYVIHGYRCGRRISEALSEMPNIACCFDFFAPPKKELPPVHRFDDIHGELHYLANRIAHLIDGGVDPSKIVVIGLDEAAHYEFRAIAEAYGFSLDPKKTPLAESAIGAFFLSEFEKSFDLEKTLSALSGRFPDHPDLPRLGLLTKTYAVPGLEKERQLEVYAGLLSDNDATAPKLEGAVKLSSSYFFEEDAHVFLASFCLNKAPRNHRDNEYLTDVEKKELGLPTSLELNRRDKEDMLALLHAPQIEAVTYSERLGEAIFYPSPLIDSEHMKFAEDNELPYEYSKAFASLWLTHLLDRKRKYGAIDKHIAPLEDQVKLSYFGYDPQYRPFAEAKRAGEIKLSATRLEQYGKCPFSYYLAKVLGLEDDEERFSTRLGRIYHEALSRLYDEQFDPEVAFQNALANEIEKEGPFVASEEVLLPRLKDRFLDAVAFIRESEQRATNARFYTERYLEMRVSPNWKIVGYADKIVLTGNEREYISVIDYKTYAPKFDPAKLEYGLSVQLPTYALLARNDKEFADKKLLGFYLMNVLPSDLSHDDKKTESATLEKSMKLNGVFLADFEAIGTFDSLINDSPYVIGLKRRKDGGFVKSNSDNTNYRTAVEIESFVEETKNKYEETFAKMERGEFPISPIRFGRNDNPCKFCGMQDVCFYRDHMIRVVEKDEDEEDEDDGE